MSKARSEYLEYEIINGLNPKIHNYVRELEHENESLKSYNQLEIDLSLKIVKLENQNEILEEDKKVFINECNELRIKKIKLEAEKAELVAEIERIEKAEQIDINLDLNDYK